MSLRIFCSRRVLSGLLLASLSFGALALSQDAPVKRGRKYKAPPPTAKFEVTVTRASTGKPVENASVIFHPLAGGHDAGNMELKTNDEGKAIIDLLEIGSDVRLQVIAPGFQTYGEDYKVDKDNMAIEVKLKRPGSQYSIYKKSEGKTAPSDQPDAKPEAKQEANPDASKDAAPGTSTTPQSSAPDAPKETPKDQAKPQSPQF